MRNVHISIHIHCTSEPDLVKRYFAATSGIFLACLNVHSAGAQATTASAPTVQVTGISGKYRFENISLAIEVESEGISPPAVARRTEYRTSPCSPTRACGPTADLRARVVLAPPVIVKAPPVPMKIEVENSGRTPAPATEVALCWRVRVENVSCEGSTFDIVNVRSLAPGEIATITAPVVWRDGVPAYETYLGAVVDPDAMWTEERRRGNNAAVSTTRSVFEEPSIEVLERFTNAQSKDGYPWLPKSEPFVSTWRIRNKSHVAATPETPIVVMSFGGEECSRRYPEQRFVLPPIPARAVVKVTMTGPLYAGSCGSASGYYGLRIEVRDVRFAGADALNWSGQIRYN